MGKVVLTGASGFIGKNFLKYIEEGNLIDKSQMVLIISESFPGYQSFSRNDPAWKSKLNNFLNDEAADVVFHLGSFTPKSGSEASNLEGSNSNISFTQELIETIKPPKRFIFTSTLDVYDFRDTVDESTSPNPGSLYAWSKLYCEKMLTAWANSNNVLLQILRVGHVYGEGEDSYKKLIPVTIEACLNAQNPTLFTKGSELRSFIYIADVCKMIYESSLLEESVGVVNLAGNEPKNVREVIDLIIELINPNLTCEINGNSSGLSTSFSNQKMIELFGSEFIPFSVGIQNEIQFFKNKWHKSRRTIYFDLDGTLIDARRRLYQLYVDLSGSKISFEDYWTYKRNQCSNEWLLGHIENFSIEKIEAFKSMWMHKIELKEYLNLDEPFPQTKELLNRLSSTANLVLITGRQSFENLTWQLKKFEFENLFTKVLNTANKITKEEKIQQYISVFKPSDIIVGDTGIEVIAGKSLGIKTAVVLSGFRNKESLEKYQPDFVFPSIQQFMEFSITNK
jgi:UDP-glucose 4-epimerase